MFNKDLQDEFHYGINDISKYREIFEEEEKVGIDSGSWLFLGLGLFLGFVGIISLLFKKWT